MRFGPISRREPVIGLQRLGFDGPAAGGNHEYGAFRSPSPTPAISVAAFSRESCERRQSVVKNGRQRNFALKVRAEACHSCLDRRLERVIPNRSWFGFA